MVFATPTELISDVLASCAGRTPYSPSEIRVAVQNFVVWASEEGFLELDPAVMFTRRNIERFVQRGLSQYTPGTRGNIRSRLLRMAELLNPDPRTLRLAPLAPAPALRPYARHEVVALRSWAATQGTPSRCSSATVLLALGLGAGLSASELAETRTQHVQDDGRAVTIDVPGARSRFVPMLDEWADDFRDAIADHPGGVYLFRSHRSHSWPNVISNFVGKTGQPRPQAGRMRSTWVVGHLAAGTNVRALVRAAGVDSLEAFTRYLDFVTEPDPITAVRQLTRAAA